MRAIDYFDKGADAALDRIAIVDGGARYTYRQTQLLSRRVAGLMGARGLRPGDAAAIYSPNHAHVLFCMLGIMRSGAVWVPVNYRNAIDANAEYLNYVDVAWLFYHSSFRDQVRQLRARVPSLSHVICIDREEDANPSLDQLLQSVNSTSDDPAASDPGALVGLVPTGGTTGAAKGVRVNALAWGTMTEMACQYWHSDSVESVCLNVAPLSHAAGVVAFTMLALGATNVIMPRFDALEVLRNIQSHRVTHLFLPPTGFYSLLVHPQVGDFDYSSLRVFLLAGSPVSPDKLKRGVEIFGPCMCQCYGQTEAPMLLTFLDQETIAAAARGDHPERLRSCGRPTSAVRVAIMDDGGQLLGPSQVGEIVARGSLVTAGYHKLPEATAAIRRYGWHHTGDVGYMDDDGFLYIVDRKKDMVITGGFNVFCGEVEAAIMALPQVHECAVIGVPDQTWGEAVKAVLVLRSGESLSEQEVIRYCKEKLGGVKAPKSVEFWPEIPKTHAGKVDRKEMRRPYWASAERAVH